MPIKRHEALGASRGTTKATCSARVWAVIRGVAKEGHWNRRGNQAGGTTGGLSGSSGAASRQEFHFRTREDPYDR